MTVAPTIAVMDLSVAWHGTPASINAAARPSTVRSNALSGCIPELRRNTCLDDHRLGGAAKRLVAADARQRDREPLYDFVERHAALLQQPRARRGSDQAGRKGAHARALYLELHRLDAQLLEIRFGKQRADLPLVVEAMGDPGQLHLRIAGKQRSNHLVVGARVRRSEERR